jgi:hypothetical protein
MPIHTGEFGDPMGSATGFSAGWFLKLESLC